MIQRQCIIKCKFLKNRSVSRFLWWEDCNLGGNLLDHEMCVHVFGGTSSPGCCNYALRKTGFYNFYVDDLLKSLETEESAVRLIRDVKAMCQAGGFNLTKFISNKKVI